MKIAIMQPTFNPWIGYFDLIDYVDTFIFFDTIQLNQQSWQTRNKLKVQNKELLFSIPIIKDKVKRELTISHAKLNFSKFDFRKKLYKTLEQNYKKAKYFDEVNEFIKEIVFFETDYLSEYNINIIIKISEKFGYKTNMIVLSKTGYCNRETKGSLVLDICKYFETESYISPLGSKSYLCNSLELFDNQKISLEYQYYEHPKYKQLGHEFIPYIGIFDILYNEGFENAKIIIQSGRLYKKE